MYQRELSNLHSSPSKYYLANDKIKLGENLSQLITNSLISEIQHKKNTNDHPENAYIEASFFIRKINKFEGQLHLSVTDDDDIYLEFIKDTKEAVVSFEGDGEFGYALLHSNKFIAGKYKGVVSESIPKDFCDYFEFESDPRK